MLIKNKDDNSDSRLNLLNIKTNTLKELTNTFGNQEFLHISGNNKKMLYKIQNDFYIYDIENRINKKIKNSDDYKGRKYFADYSGRYLIYLNSGFKVQDTKTGTTKTLKLPGYNWEIANDYTCKPNDNNVYFSGSSSDATGIFSIYAAKLNENVVSSRKCIYKDIDTYAVIKISSWWTLNNKTVLVDEEDSNRSSEKRHFKLRQFDF